ncbi:hypothetical protein CDL15_Pgr022768 [Punica granatum]|uniref:Uncharacterized protein n=1 Tax=Punica granatum TaxID=22663 RepID=A0A218XR37_PUNGR|nr:hypothetical protein CDL15_Pgr022768 [Punica granatum]
MAVEPASTDLVVAAAHMVVEDLVSVAGHVAALEGLVAVVGDVVVVVAVTHHPAQVEIFFTTTTTVAAVAESVAESGL